MNWLTTVQYWYRFNIKRLQSITKLKTTRLRNFQSVVEVPGRLQQQPGDDVLDVADATNAVQVKKVKT